MDAELSAVPKMYAPLVWSSSSDTKVAYTGARIRLRMKLSVQDRIETVELDHEEEPRPSIPPDGCCSKPSDAPFENLYFEKVAPGLLRTLMLATQPVLLVNAVDGSAGDESRRFHDASVEAARGTRDPELVRCLARALLREKDESARQRIASVLKDSWAKEGIDLLVAALGSVDTEDRRRAAEALGGIGDSRAGRPLVQALEDPERSVRSAAMVSLGKLSYRDAVPSLIRIFSNTAEDRSLRNLAGIVLDGLAATHTEKLPEPERIKLWQSRTKP